MKYLLTFLALLPLTVWGATVINYDDGSTLTLEEGEKIHVTKSKLYTQRTYNNGRTFQFKEFPETTRRDYVPVDNGTDGEAFGTHAWCKAYVPWSEGYTFTMQYWQRGCDTNNDGTYGCGDEKFDASDDASVCPAG
jgi:hypothetical protein